jgi:hypothetical protein
MEVILLNMNFTKINLNCKINTLCYLCLMEKEINNEVNIKIND